MGIIVMLGVVGSVLAGFAAFIVHLNRRAKLAASGGGWSACGTPVICPRPRRRGSLNVESSLGCRLPRRSTLPTSISLISRRALADAGALRRMGRVFRVRPGQVPEGREPARRLSRRQGQDFEDARNRHRRRRNRAAGVLRDSGVGETRRRISRPTIRRPSCGLSASSSPGTFNIPVPTANSAAPMSA